MSAPRIAMMMAAPNMNAPTRPAAIDSAARSIDSSAEIRRPLSRVTKYIATANTVIAM